MSSFKSKFFRPMDLNYKRTGGTGQRAADDQPGNQDPNIGDSQNCAVHSVIETNIQYMDVFDTMPRVGKVKSCWINLPDAGHPNTSTIKVVFFTHEAAQQLLDRAAEWTINSVKPYCVWDRNRVAPEDPTGKSRVLRIVGKSEFVNFDTLTRYFDDKLRYQTQKVGTIRLGLTGMNQVDWYFASYSNQAQAACMALGRERVDVPENKEAVRLEYRPDPCDPSTEP